MNISGIRPMEGFYTYNINRINEQRNLQIQNAQEAEEKQKVLQAEPQQEAKAVAVSAQPEQKFTAFDYAKKYEPEATYELVGAESNIHDLDIEKAISDMQKDQLLQQYQFFVGSSSQKIAEPVSLVELRPMENFELQLS